MQTRRERPSAPIADFRYAPSFRTSRPLLVRYKPAMHFAPLEFGIRHYQPSDAGELARLYFDSARQLGARRYSPEQVAAWAPTPGAPDAVHARASDGRTTWVAVSAGSVIGYVDLEKDGHIDHLYCAPRAAGRGVASALIDALLGHASEHGMGRLWVEASELARGLFERKGFIVTERRDFVVRGVPIHNFAMERPVQ